MTDIKEIVNTIMTKYSGQTFGSYIYATKWFEKEMTIALEEVDKRAREDEREITKSFINSFIGYDYTGVHKNMDSLLEYMLETYTKLLKENK